MSSGISLCPPEEEQVSDGLPITLSFVSVIGISIRFLPFGQSASNHEGFGVLPDRHLTLVLILLCVRRARARGFLYFRERAGSARVASVAPVENLGRRSPGQKHKPREPFCLAAGAVHGAWRSYVYD